MIPMKNLMKRTTRFIAMFLIAVLAVTTLNGNVQAASKKKKTVILYFSATGTTKSVAKKIKKAAKGTLIEIKAEDKYTDDDLDWTEDDSRVTKEHESADSPAVSNVRPKIANAVSVTFASPRKPSVPKYFMTLPLSHLFQAQKPLGNKLSNIYYHKKTIYSSDFFMFVAACIDNFFLFYNSPKIFAVNYKIKNDAELRQT